MCHQVALVAGVCSPNDGPVHVSGFRAVHCDKAFCGQFSLSANHVAAQFRHICDNCRASPHAKDLLTGNEDIQFGRSTIDTDRGLRELFDREWSHHCRCRHNEECWLRPSLTQPRIKVTGSDRHHRIIERAPKFGWEKYLVFAPPVTLPPALISSLISSASAPVSSTKARTRAKAAAAATADDIDALPRATEDARSDEAILLSGESSDLEYENTPRKTKEKKKGKSESDKEKDNGNKEAAKVDAE